MNVHVSCWNVGRWDPDLRRAGDGPAERLLRAMRCHRAWMMLAESGMDDCPLDLAGLYIQAHGDASGITVELRMRDPKLVPEL